LVVLAGGFGPIGDVKRALDNVVLFQVEGLLLEVVNYLETLGQLVVEVDGRPEVTVVEGLLVLRDGLCLLSSCLLSLTLPDFLGSFPLLGRFFLAFHNLGIGAVHHTLIDEFVLALLRGSVFVSFWARIFGFLLFH
jgi:hypothetical protein